MRTVLRADLRTTLREGSRAIRRHRALLAGGLAAAAVATALPVLAPSPPAGLVVVAAARDLAPGTPLVAADLAHVSFPQAVVPAGVLTSAADLVGRVLAGPVRQGEALTDVRLLGSGLLLHSSGLVATPVRLADPATAAFLRAGDRVDVLAARTALSGPASTAATTVAAGVQVLAVPRAGDDGAEGALVVLAATPATAAKLAAAAVGSRLSVTVLAP